MALSRTVFGINHRQQSFTTTGARARNSTTHALLFAFRGTPQEDGVSLLSDAMRKIGWKVSVYLFGQDASTAQTSFDNLAYSLRSRVRGLDERIVVYYGGHAIESQSIIVEGGVGWVSECDIIWHGPASDDTNGCPNCTVRIDPTNFFKQLISYIPNDVLIISHAWLDEQELLAWSKSIDLRTDSKKDRIVQVLRFDELKSTLMPRGDRECYLCDTRFDEMVTLPDPAWQQSQAAARLAMLLDSATPEMQLNDLTIRTDWKYLALQCP